MLLLAARLVVDVARLSSTVRTPSFVHDDRGQDVVEYALLVATIGLAAVAAEPAIRVALGTALTLMNFQTQDQWIPPNPGA